MAQYGLDTEIQFLPGVGPKRAALFSKELGITTVGDMIRTYPFRYIDRSTFVRIADARPDMAYVQVRAKVLRKELLEKRMSVWIGDGSGEMELVFFKGIKWLNEKLQPSQEYVFFGKPSSFNGRINMVHPEVDPSNASSSPYKIITASGENQETLSTNGTGTLGSKDTFSAGAAMTGVYPSTEKLKNAGITTKLMNRIKH